MSNYAIEIMEELLDSNISGVLPAKFTEGKGNLLLITGENATGKSLFSKGFKVFSQRKYPEIHLMRVGMDRRTQGGIERAFMFGNESEESTGAISVHNVKGMFKTSRARHSEGKEHTIILDEPDIGLSESYQGALGKFILDYYLNQPENLKALIIVTHSRHIIKHLVDQNPHHLRVGDEYSLEEFVAGLPEKGIDDLEKLAELALQNFRKVSKILSR